MSTFGIRYGDGYFWVYLMGMNVFGDRSWWASRSHWCSESYRYKDLESALRRLSNADAVMIFPGLVVPANFD
jgi:hypothetical protein